MSGTHHLAGAEGGESALMHGRQRAVAIEQDYRTPPSPLDV
jgi:hypothetical protein